MTTSEAKSKPKAKIVTPSNEALVVGGGVAGMQAALDIANQGFKVYLLEKTPSIGGRMAMIDKTFPTLDCSACILTPRLSEVSRHPNIDLLTYSEIKNVTGKTGNFKVKVLKKARYVDLEKCSGCADCVPVCPVEVPNEFDQNIGFRKAIYVPFPQATPNIYTVDKRGHPPCRTACPAGVNGQGFITLLGKERFGEALRIYLESNPFPGVLGRVCPAFCEKECTRGKIDDKVDIRSLHRFIADYERKHGGAEDIQPAEKRKEKVAVVGAGPAGISCAYQLARLGYPVTVFEARSEPGGLLRWGIPEYRLPRDILKEEIARVENLGVKMLTNKPVKSLKDLLDKGYKAVFLGTGAPVSTKLKVKGEDAKGVFHALHFLDDVNRGKDVKLGKRIAVIGGGNAAIDSSRTANRLGTEEVTIVYRRSRLEMPAIASEVDDAEEEGIHFEFLASPIEVLVEGGAVSGIRCIRMKLGEPDESGRRRPVPIRGSEFDIPIDSVIIAIGQRVSPEGPHTELEPSKWGTPIVDSITYETSMKGIFAGGDVVTGPATVVEAVAAGNEAACSIDRYLRGVDMKEGRPSLLPTAPPPEVDEHMLGGRTGITIPKLDIIMREDSFNEVELGLDRHHAVAEADRCLDCAVCCECKLCVQACTREAIDHSMRDEEIDLDVGAIVVATGYRLFDVTEYPRFGYTKFPNVIHAMEYERLINAAGPTHGHLIRLSDGKKPKSIGFIQCVGARDVTKGVPYCSRVCCMYGIKNAVMAREHDPDIDVTIYYADIRSFGKGFEEFYQMAKTRFGVKFIRGRVAEVNETPVGNNLILRYEDVVESKVLETEHDLVVLAPGVIPPLGLEEIAKQLNIEMSEEGYIEVEHPFWGPVDTRIDGVFVCGCADGPKDIPDSVTAGSAAAMHATIILSKGGAKK